jgi:uncharacterized protein YbjT (DUF2867 family)
MKALTEPGHAGKAYTLTGPAALTYDQVADELSEALRRPIRHVNLSPEDYKAGILAEGLPEPLANLMVDLERYFREGRAGAVTEDIQSVTGQAPRWFTPYARETAATGVWTA